MTEAQRRASKKYDANNTRTFCLKLNYNTDADLISFLEASANIQGTIKRILEDHLRRL